MIGPRDVPLLVRTVLHAFGVRGVARRLAYASQLRTGLLRRRLPATGTFDDFAPVVWRHRFDLPTIRAGYDALPDVSRLRAQIRDDVDALLAGRQVLYGALDVTPGWPPRWDVDPMTAHAWPRAHWTLVPDDAPEIGDIKDVWELSRLPATFLLARAYAAGAAHADREQLAEAWWVMLEDWMAANPPNLGVNWRCGQETSLRAIAVGFGLSTFIGAPASTPLRVAAAGRLLAASVARVRPTVGYALSQRNNHAVSELVLLLTIDGPRRRWCRLLTEVLKDQWYPDGSYAQQSANYQRLAVQALQWLLTVHDDLPSDLIDHVRDVLGRSAVFLARTSDPVSGTLSNMGANDGAHLLPLSAAAHHDVRPLLASLGVTTGHAVADEQALWIHTPVDLPDLTHVPTVWPSMRRDGVHVLLHAGAGRHRASHADQLAIEAQVGGQPIIVDAGSFRYSGTAPWRNPFVGPAGHASITLNGERARRVGRFLTVPQTPAEVLLLADSAVADASLLVCRRVGPDGTLLWRTVIVGSDGLLVLDAAVSGRAVTRHLLASTAAQEHLAVRFAAASGEVLPVPEHSEDDPASGWWAPSYAQRAPCCVLHAVLDADGSAVLSVGRTTNLFGTLDELHATVPADIVSNWRTTIVLAG